MIEHIIDFIAPHTCVSCQKEGSLICYGCRSSMNYSNEAVTLSSIDTIQAATIYEDNAKELIGRLKFGRVKAAARVIASIMAARQPMSGVVVTHLPTATSRVRMRGYDQAALIAREYARLCHLQYVPLLYRLGHERQVGSGGAERRKQLAQAFRVRGRPGQYEEVLLIDDVLTTGSTLEAAAAVLRLDGVNRVHAAVFAVSRK